MPLRREECEPGVWQPQRCSRLWSPVPSQATQSDSAVMKSEAHGRLYVIISGSLKPDREWLSWMVIVTLPPWETRRALGLLHRDIQSYSLLHIMELSSQRANGSDPFNLCQKHTDEEVPNARPLPWGRHTPPPPPPPLWLLTSCCLIHWLVLLTYPHSLFSLGRQGGSLPCRSLHMPLLHTRRTQGHSRRDRPSCRKEPIRARRGMG